MTVSAESPLPEDASASSVLAAEAGGAVSANTSASHGQRVPDFFIIGHEQSGTTALYRMLKRHPQIFMPDLKEPRFFMRDAGSQLPNPNGVYPHTLDEYLSLFAAARPEQRAGEASPQYIRSPAAARRIATVQPAARIIAILREPTSFLRTYHFENVGSSTESERDLRKALALEECRRKGECIPRRCQAPNRLLYSDHVRYVEQLRCYEALFPSGHLLPIIYDDFRRDNEATVRSVLRFLDVDDSLLIETIEVISGRRKTVRFIGLHHVTRALKRARHNPAAAGPVSRAVSALTPGLLSSHMAQGIWRRVVYSVPPPPDEELLLELRRRFKPEVVALSDYLDRDLVTLWGYDGID
jgi:Sulfotransferase family